MTFGNFHDILEVLYFLSGIVVAGTAIYALNELKIHKEGIEREAATETARQIDRFNENIIHLHVQLVAFNKENGIKAYSGKIKNFNPAEEDVVNWQKQNSDKPNHASINFLNSLEAFSLYFTKGICDLHMAYRSVAHIFVGFVRYCYPNICLARKNNEANFTPIIDLYRIWNGMLRKERLEKEGQQLEKTMTQIKEAVSAIGTPKTSVIGVDSKKKS